MAVSHVETCHQPATVRGRYLLRVGGEAGAHAPLLVVTHGYGENAAAALEQVQRLPGTDQWILVSIDALHPFYTKKGDVVRSWMTKEDRELAIEDNTAYVADVVEAVIRRRRDRGGDVPALVFAGFSQGVAMAWRGLAGCLRRGVAVHGLIALAADVPPDVAAEPPPGLPPVLLGRGTQDAWYSEDKMNADLATLNRMGVQVTPHVFEGGHLWHDEFVAAAGRFLEQHQRVA